MAANEPIRTVGAAGWATSFRSASAQVFPDVDAATGAGTLAVEPAGAEPAPAEPGSGVKGWPAAGAEALCGTPAKRASPSLEPQLARAQINKMTISSGAMSKRRRRQ
jgi:hypothetical protein